MSADLDLEKLFSVRTVEVVEQVQAENLKLALKHVFDELRRAAEAQQAAGIDSLRETVSSLKEAEKAAQVELVAVQAVQVRCRVCAHIPAWGSHHFKTQHTRGNMLSKQALRERCHLSTDISSAGRSIQDAHRADQAVLDVERKLFKQELQVPLLLALRHCPNVR